ncbi:MAG: hypothetical protein LBT14_09320 [Treponema sp.]|nr:hypothetical protein [Treponema sp.]
MTARPCIRGKRAFDTVAPCGGSASGHFCKTLTGTSPYSGWMEFINKPLLEWCLTKHLQATRSRPYRKNDNCFAEQKNYDAVRKTVGYFRFDTPAEQEALAGVYNYLCPLYNYWYPSFRLDRQGKAAGRPLQESVREKPQDSLPAAA